MLLRLDKLVSPFQRVNSALWTKTRHSLLWTHGGGSGGDQSD